MAFPGLESCLTNTPGERARVDIHAALLQATKQNSAHKPDADRLALVRECVCALCLLLPYYLQGPFLELQGEAPLQQALVAVLTEESGTLLRRSLRVRVITGYDLLCRGCGRWWCVRVLR